MYLLPNHVHICTTPQASVFLDLRNDRYTGLSPEQTRALSLLVEGWPGDRDPSGIDERLAAQTADGLLERGLLTLDPAAGHSAAPIQITQATEVIWEWSTSAKVPRINPVHVFSFALSYVLAASTLRALRFEKVVTRITERKARAGVSTDSDVAKLRVLTAAFLTLRPLLYTSRDRCLLDSLALVEFLARHGLFPTWVIGVQTAPFAAHSWVQMGRYVLNNPPRYIQKFTPIFAV